MEKVKSTNSLKNGQYICDNPPNPPFDPTDPYTQEYLNICNHTLYCQALEATTKIEMTCMESSILELWGYDYDFTTITRYLIFSIKIPLKNIYFKYYILKKKSFNILVYLFSKNRKT